MSEKGGIFKKITSVLVTFLMVLSTIAISPIKADAATPKGYITMSVEKFTLGLGYIIEPIKVPFYQGDNGAKILTRELEKRGYKYRNTGSADDESGIIGNSFYLSYIKDNEKKQANIPKYITDQIAKDNGDEPYGRQEANWLGEFDYTFMSGWMYAVNNVFPGYGVSQYHPKDGDVMRWQFTVWGYGTDLGAVSEWSGHGFCTIADKTKLTEKIAEVNSASNSKELLANSAVSKAYNKAYEVMEDMTISKSEVDSAYKNLSNAITAAEQKPDPTPPVVDKVTGFKSTGTTTSQVNLAWNKVEGADGYQVLRYSTTSKKYVVIGSTTNCSYKDGSRTSATIYNYKVRAYKTVNGKKVTITESEKLKAVTKPLTPSITVKSTSTKKATVSWTNCSKNATGYKVYMAKSKNGTYSLVKTTTAKSFTKTGLTKGKTYYFKVRAYRTVDGKNIYGNYSTIKSVKVK